MKLGTSDDRKAPVASCSRTARWQVRSAVVLGTVLIALGAGPARAQSLVLNDAAHFASGRLRLTSTSPTFQRGTAWTAVKYRVDRGFIATFSFQITQPGGITDRNGETGGDGFTFAIHNFETGVNAAGDWGEGLGYGRIPNCLAVEFDLFANDYDPNGNHISIHTRGTAPNDPHESASIGWTTRIPNLSDGRVHTATVTYTAPAGRAGLLQVAVDGRVVLAVRVNLAQVLSLDNGAAHLGFTAGTGDAVQNHDILSWSSALDERIGRDCPNDGSTIQG